MTPTKKGSCIAKGGYNEEKHILSIIYDFIDYALLKLGFEKIRCNNAKQIVGTKKSDIQVGPVNIQVKKTTGIFGQVGRYWIDKLVSIIPDLSNVSYILKKTWEFPVVDNKCVRTNCKFNNFSNKELLNLVDTLEKTKIDILKFAFLGDNPEYYPDLFLVSYYKNNTRNKIIVWKTMDIIDYIAEFPVRIRERGTVIEFGPAFTMQRKGGDSGNPTANQLQFKLGSNWLLKDPDFVKKAFVYYF